MHSYFRPRALAGRLAAITPVLLGGVLALPAMAQQTPVATQAAPAADTTTYTLTRVYKAGDSDRYKLKVHSIGSDPQSSNQDIRFEIRFKESVKEIKPDGTVLLTDEFSKAIGHMNEQDMDLTASMPKVTQTIDKKGQLVDVTTDGGIELLNVGITQMFQTLGHALQEFHPQQAIKAGDSWKIDLTNPKEPTDKTTGTATLIGLETVGGMQTVKIKLVVDAKTKEVDPTPGASSAKIDVTSHFDGTGNVDPKSGKLVKLSGRGDNQMPGSSKRTTEMELAMVTGPDDDKADAAKPADKKPGG